MERDVSYAMSTLGRLAGIGGVDAAFLRDHLRQEAAEAERFWYRFPVTPYNSMPLSEYREEIFRPPSWSTAADADRYLSLLNDYTALAEQAGDTMEAQRERGIRLPAWAVPEAMSTIRGHAAAAEGLLVTADRCAALAPGPAGRLTDAVSVMVRGRLAAAFARILDDLAGDERPAVKAPASGSTRPAPTATPAWSRCTPALTSPPGSCTRSGWRRPSGSRSASATS